MAYLWLFRNHRRIGPRFKADLSQSRVLAGNQGKLAQFHAEISRIRVHDYFARIVASAQPLPDELVKAKSLRPRHFNQAVQRCTNCDRATALATSSAAIGWM